VTVAPAGRVSATTDVAAVAEIEATADVRAAAETVATVHGEPVTLAQVEALLARMRTGPAAHLLPADGGAESRQVRRWLVQLTTTRLLLDAWATARGVVPRPEDEQPWTPDPVTALELGSVPCAVLASSAIARAVARTVTADVVPHDDEVRDYHRRNAARWSLPARRQVRHAVFADRLDAEAARQAAPTDPRSFAAVADELGWIRPDDFAGPFGAAVAEATPGTLVGPVRCAHGWILLIVDDDRPARDPDVEQVRGQIVAELAGAARRRAFGLWLDVQRRASVRLAPGFEHPGDPRQPDNTHKH
jgi:[acyl-carrier-protein] S-malonyltransferase